jgi:TrmH family RNA methyltransferase
MISKSELKLIRALKSKKQRDKMNMFVAEGAKLVEHYNTNNMVLKNVFHLESYGGDLWSEDKKVTEKEMQQISSLESASPILAIFEKPDFQVDFSSDIMLALDDVRDPGNMGTIIRLADWFGVSTIFCSPNCVDVFNSKVVQSTMGSLSNVNVARQELSEVFKEAKNNGIHVIGAEMKGTALSKFETNNRLMLVMGNEANGINPENQKLLDESITIEKAKTSQAESLNVAMATSILLGRLSSI